MDIRIKYADKTANHPEHITHLGDDSGRETVSQIVKWIENGTHTFYTFENGKRANIRVMRVGFVRVWLQTFADGEPTNNLLMLPPCRVRAA